MKTKLHRPTVPSRLVVLAIGGGLALASFEAAFAQLAATLSGAPQQVIPYASEPGVPALTIPLGTPSQFPTDNGSGGTGAGNNGSGSGGGGPAGGSTALGTMMSQSWGALAAANAQALGVNASALAATCVVESGCQNVGGSGSVAGAFQMTASTYTSMIQTALAQNPSLASQIVQGSAGQMDPVSESIAASEYLLQGAQYLQAQGISDPSVVDVRGYYNFGPAGGAAIANAPPTATIASVLSMYSPTVLANNGITPGETVSQWQSSVAAKIGNAANQSVLSS
jgi:hypothetical protein